MPQESFPFLASRCFSVESKMQFQMDSRLQVEDPRRIVEGAVQPVQASNQMHLPYEFLSRGSSTSRMPSPRKLNPRTARKTAAPGPISSQGSISI